MADRVYPSAKPSAGVTHAFPATKAQTFPSTYRPQPPPKHRRSRHRCCCCCFLWIAIVILALAAIAGGVFYLLYRPQRPAFTVSSLRLSQFSLTGSNALNSRLDVVVAARNPNKKISFLYDPVSISVSSDGIPVGDGSFPAFVLEPTNSTVLKSTVSSVGESLDSTAAAELKKKRNLPLEINLETNAGVKIRGTKTKKIGIKVSCGGFSVAVPKTNKAGTSMTGDVTCKVKLRIKIWKWTI